MPSFEDICQKIFSDPQFWNKLLIGGLLSFIPGLNILALGYLYQYSLKVRRQGEFTLPLWRHWSGLFWNGLRFLLLFLLFFLLPLFLGWLLFALLRGLHLGVIAFLPLGLALLLGPILSVAALYCYQTHYRFEDLLRLDLIGGMVLASWKQMLFPLFAFIGLIFVGSSLMGFVFFLGFAAIIAYGNVVFRHIEKQNELTWP